MDTAGCAVVVDSRRKTHRDVKVVLGDEGRDNNRGITGYWEAPFRCYLVLVEGSPVLAKKAFGTRSRLPPPPVVPSNSMGAGDAT